MNTEEQRRFYFYLFEPAYPYYPNSDAISDTICRQFAEKIIHFWDEFTLECNNPTKEEMKKHLNNYLKLLLSELSEDFPLIEPVRTEIRNQDQDNQEHTGVFDHLIRIRAVFGLDDSNTNP